MVAPLSIAGRVFGRLTVLRRDGSLGTSSAWQCRCECGRIGRFMGTLLTQGHTTSCGCAVRERIRTMGKANRVHGMSRTPTYASWFQMWQRCRNKNSKDYPRWGGRGITVCDRWQSFASFLADMGERPPGMTLDRYPDNGGNYEPGNCRWATASQQVQNSTSVTNLTYDGQTYCIAEWSRRIGIKEVTIGGRLKRGWSVERALQTAVRERGR